MLRYLLRSANARDGRVPTPASTWQGKPRHATFMAWYRDPGSERRRLPTAGRPSLRASSNSSSDAFGRLTTKQACSHLCKDLFPEHECPLSLFLLIGNTAHRHGHKSENVTHTFA